MRIIALVLAALGSAAAHAQIWEKPVAPGLIYRMEIDPSGPRHIHALRFSLKAPEIEALPELGKQIVFTEDVNKSRATVSEMVAASGAIAGINADFFPWTGDPIGLMMRFDEILSTPYRNRGAFAWGKGGAMIGASKFEGSFSVGGRDAVVLTGVNQECGENEIVINMPIAGFSRAKGTSTLAIAKITKGALTSGGELEGEVTAVAESTSPRAIKSGEFVITATGNKRSHVSGLRRGQKIAVKAVIEGMNWRSLDHAVAGGPVLIRGGKVEIGAVAEGFGEAFSTTRHPRTAIGISATGEIWIVVVDGRQSMSVGASLPELADIMKRLGCTEALNLDGGGSSALNLFGLTMNRPSDGPERAVANGLVITGPKVADPGIKYAMSEVSELKVGQTANLKITDPAGQDIPNLEIIWAASGNGWIDQGGSLTAVKAGPCTIKAFVRGRILTQSVTCKD